jgi:hypothetical protein
MTPIKFVYEPSTKSAQKAGPFEVHREWPTVPRKGETVTLTPIDSDPRTYDFMVEHVRYQEGAAILHLTYLGER